MPWRKKQDVPWYRRHDYRGQMSEEEKRHLDTIRSSGHHPAVTYEQLPEEVQSYISELELKAYDAKQESLVGRTFLVSALGAFLFDANFLHWLDMTNVWLAAIAVPMLILPWPYYFWRWRQNADEFLPPSSGAANSTDPTDDALRTAWEVNFIVKRTRRQDR